ncbi:MAG: hypothetical protein Tsb0013_23200 [Phycisphaerales bacterium]
MRSACLALIAIASFAHAEEGVQTATGYVFHDVNANGVREPGEPGVHRVLVSNGRDVVRTAPDGSYEIQVDDDDILFVCKPRDWMVPVDENGLPQHHYLHKPGGSPDLKYGGVAPTGPLPESVDFPLVPHEESERFSVILFGDPQPYSIEQVDHFKNDIMPEVLRYLDDDDAAFGATLGDIVGDDLDLFAPLNDVIGAAGIPWLNVYGNHDMDFDAPGDEHADETFNRVYGPTTYAYRVANIHFIVMDNVLYDGQRDNGKNGGYRAGITDEQQTFLRNYFYAASDGAGENERFVLLMHIPAVEFDDLMSDLFGDEIPSDAPQRIMLSVGAHWHRHGDHMIEVRDDRGNAAIHHHITNVTTSGSWWQGQPDEYGIPHTMMRDGKPNGWSVLTFDPDLPHRYEIRYKAARRPWDDQLHIHAPDRVRIGSRDDRTVTVNLWSGNQLSQVQVRYVHTQSGDTTAWRTIPATRGVDPFWARLKRLEARGKAPEMTGLDPETWLWIDQMPETLRPGSYTIEVRETNRYGHVHTATRIVRVTE